MRFGLLGPLAVWSSEGRPVPVPEAKVRALLADLLVHEGRPVSPGRLVEDLWGADPPGNPTNTLQTKVSQLRRALEKAEPGARELVEFLPAGYRLRADTDVQEFRSLAAEARAGDDPRVRARLLGDALALWRGPALAEVADESFAIATAHRLDEERLTVIEDAAEARLALGEHDALVAELAELVAAHPRRERLHGLQMRALYRAGRQQEALDAYTALRESLAAELGLEPGPELATLHASILRHDPRLGGRRRSNLPAPMTALVGRAGAQSAIRDVMTRNRLVTLTGAGGVGKTRLAVEIARETDGDVVLVELAGTDTHPEEHLAAAFGIREDPTSPADLVDRIAGALQGSATLLVLDNCEHMVEAVAGLASRLLRRVAGLTVLATSQEPLGVDGEALWPVPPLDDRGAAELFVTRAQAAAPGAALDADAVAAICRRLDGIPLALELAATRVRALGVHELLSRLDDRFRLLDNGRRDAPSRHRTLRAMIDWSWRLLSEPEQAVLRRLAVHADGCDLAAVDALSGLPPSDVPGMLARLVDRSLVAIAPGPRYRLLESVAAYCVERLAEAGELDDMRLRHARYFVELAERLAPCHRGDGQRRSLERIDAESANLRVALDTAVHAGDADLALRLVNAQTWYWFLRGRLCEADRAARAALGLTGGSASARAEVVAWQTGLAVLSGAPTGTVLDAPTAEIDDPDARARAEWFLGYALTTIGDMASAERITRQIGADPWTAAATASVVATQEMTRGDIPAARKAAARSAELFVEIGDRWGRLQVTFALGALAEMSGDYAEAARLFRDGLHSAEALGLWPEVSYQHSWLGRIALLTGDHEQATALHERAMRIAAEQGFVPGEMYAETGLALGARRQGRLDDAEKHLLRLLDWHRTGFEPGATLILAELGFVAEQRGDAATARAFHAEGLALAKRVGDPRAEALALEGLAGVQVLDGEPAEALRLLDEAAALRESVGVPLPPAERGDVERIAAAARALV